MKQYKLRQVIGGKGQKPDQLSEALRGISVDASDRVYAVGDSEVKVFDSGGKLERRWKTAKPGYCATATPTGDVYVGEQEQIEKFDKLGRRVDVLRDPSRLELPTALAVSGDSILVGDTARRAILRYDKSGKFLNAIGADNRMKGFLIPNGHVDFVVDDKKIIHAANPGKHRVEHYTMEGKLLGRFGKFGGRNPEGFSGCCNPTNVTLTRDGHFVVTVKAPPGVKEYDATGKLLAFFGTGDFDPNCKNMDVAVDSRGWIYVADTVRLQIRVFEPQKTAAVEPAATTEEGERKR